MVLTREIFLVGLLSLASLFCDVTGIVTSQAGSSFGSVGKRDQVNWNLLAANYAQNNTQRTGNGKLPVFSKILLANIKARTKVGRSDDGVFLYQGDIRLTKAEMKKVLSRNTAINRNKGRRKRATLSDKTALWTSPIHYQLSPSLGKTAIKAINGAIREWQRALPCLQWKKGTSSSQYLYFISGDGCYSAVGKGRGKRKQEISIGVGCEDHGTVLHEIAHALGFGHEQARPDRDKYVKIIWNNIISGMKFNFEKYSKSEVDSLGKPYDFASVMHYGPTDFARNDGLTTIRSKIPNKTFGDKPKLSKLDEEQARLLYKCKTGKGKYGTPATPPPNPPTQPPPPLPSTTLSGSGSGAGGYSG